MLGLFQARFAKPHEFFAKVKCTVQRAGEENDLSHRHRFDRKMQIVPETIRHRAGAASFPRSEQAASKHMPRSHNENANQNQWVILIRIAI